MLIRHARPGLLVASATALLLVLTGSPGQADDAPDSVVIPQHARATGVTLIGASPAGVAVLRDRLTPTDPDVVMTSGWGQPLTARAQVNVAPGFREYRQTGDVTGGVLAWGMSYGGSNSTSTLLHRTDLVTGRTTVDGRVAGSEFQLTGDGGSGSWLSLAGLMDYYPLPNPGLVRSPLSTAPGKNAWFDLGSSVWKPDTTGGLVSWEADGTTAVLALRDWGSGSYGEPNGALHLVSTPLDGGATKTLASPGLTDLIDLALGTSTVAWSTKDSSGVRVVSTVPRTGGTPADHVETDAKADLERLAVTDDGTVGYLVKAGSTGVTLRTVHGTSVRDVSLPEGSAGLAAVGEDFVTATGYGTQPGVYRIGPDYAPALATSRATTEYPLESWDFDAGRVYYADRAKGDARNLALWSRPVAADLTLGTETRLASPAGALLGAMTALPVAFSGARAIVGSPKYNLQWDLLDRGKHTTSIEQIPIKTKTESLVPEANPQVSGPYELLGGQIHRSDGELLALLPNSARRSGEEDLFGSKAIYSSLTATSAQVSMMDGETGRSSSLFAQKCKHVLQVALWGRTAAWLNCDATRAAVRDLVTGSTRSIATGISANVAPAGTDLTLGEGTLAWTAAGQATVLDLSSPGSTPVSLPGTTNSLTLDRGLVARSLQTSGQAAELTISRLPFAVASHPRLTGTVRLLGFSPDGDGVRDTWAPSFDTTEPLSSATLRITAQTSGRTVRTLTTEDVADGSIRGLSWDGRTGSGQAAAKGYYTWTLTARSRAGAALTTATDGTRISGRVELSR